MNLTELSDLVKVTEHLKNVINSAGVSRFNNVTLSALKKRLSEFDEMFISEMLAYEQNNQSTAKTIHEAIQAARTKMTEEKNPQPKNLHPDLSKLLFPTKEVNNTDNALKEEKTTKVKRAKKEPEEVLPKEEVVTTASLTETPPVVSKVVSAVNQPYQDESLAAMLAAEKKKIAAKKK